MYAVMFHDDTIIDKYVKQLMTRLSLTCWQQIKYEQILVLYILLITVDVGLIM